MFQISEETRQQIENIALYYSEPRQIAKGIEEFSELQQVLAKYLAKGGTYEGYKEHLTEELADSIIMLIQIIFLEGIDGDDVLKAIKYKVERQLQRIQDEKVKYILDQRQISKGELEQLQKMVAWQNVNIAPLILGEKNGNKENS
jgi:NTP pyrophosphatase (non-canonical NTP hydrolase)